MSDLKPCPFCGVEGELCTYYGGGEHNETVYTVMCDNDDCPMNVLTPDCLTEAEAIAAWNSRAERTCQVNELDALTQTLSMANGCSWGECSECGCLTPTDSAFCVECGAKVVSE